MNNDRVEENAEYGWKSKLRYFVVFLAGTDIILFIVTIITGLLFEVLYCKGKPMKIPCGPMYKSSETIENLMPIWHYWKSAIEVVNSYSYGLYYIIFEFTLILAMGYIVLEVWLFCVLYKASAQRNIFCYKKWLWWRTFVVTMTFVFYAVDLSQFQYTCIDIALFPITMLRVLSILIVLYYGKLLQRGDYDDYMLCTKI